MTGMKRIKVGAKRIDVQNVYVAKSPRVLGGTHRLTKLSREASGTRPKLVNKQQQTDKLIQQAVTFSTISTVQLEVDYQRCAF